MPTLCVALPSGLPYAQYLPLRSVEMNAFLVIADGKVTSTGGERAGQYSVGSDLRVSEAKCQNG